MELDAEIEAQLDDGVGLDHLADPAEVERITDGLLKYVEEREIARLMGLMEKDQLTVN
jgi:hypothetical protein